MLTPGMSLSLEAPTASTRTARPGPQQQPSPRRSAAGRTESFQRKPCLFLITEFNRRLCAAAPCSGDQGQSPRLTLEPAFPWVMSGLTAARPSLKLSSGCPVAQGLGTRCLMRLWPRGRPDVSGWPGATRLLSAQRKQAPSVRTPQP